MGRGIAPSLTCVLALVTILVPARAQDPPPASAPPPADTKPAETAAPMTLDEAIFAARAMFERLENSETEVTWAQVSEELNRYIAAIQTQDPKNPWLFYLWGRGFILGGRRSDAIEQLNRFVETREGRNEWTAYLLLGDMFVEEFPRLAQSNYQKAAALKANDPGVLLGLSRCADKVGKPEDALRLAQEAVVADGRRSVKYLAHLARVYVRDRKWDEAEQNARAALSLAQHDARNRIGQGRPLRVVDAQYQLLIDILANRLNEPESPTRLTDDGLRLVAVLRERTELQLELAHFEVLRVLETVVARVEPNVPVRMLEQFGVSLAEVKRRDQAIKVFERILGQEPENATAKEWIDRLSKPTGEPSTSAKSPPGRD